MRRFLFPCRQKLRNLRCRACAISSEYIKPLARAFLGGRRDILKISVAPAIRRACASPLIPPKKVLGVSPHISPPRRAAVRFALHRGFCLGRRVIAQRLASLSPPRSCRLPHCGKLRTRRLRLPYCLVRFGFGSFALCTPRRALRCLVVSLACAPSSACFCSAGAGAPPPPPPNARPRACTFVVCLLFHSCNSTFDYCISMRCPLVFVQLFDVLFTAY